MYDVTEKVQTILEIPKENIKASTHKIERFEEFNKQYQQNKPLQSNQKKFEVKMDGNTQGLLPH